MPSLPSQHRLVAVDTNVLLDFAAKDEAVLDAVATIRRRLRHADLIVSPTVVLELGEISQRDPKPEAREAARAALLSVRREWGFKPMNLMPVGHGIVERIGERLLERGLIPREERHDAFILAEAALLGCSILLSGDQHLRGIDHERASLELKAADVDMPVMNGFELTAAVRVSNKWRDLPVVLVTARERESDKARGIEAGANAYLVKSAFEQRNLLETIAQLM